MSFYVFWLRKRPSIKSRNCWGWVSSKMRTVAHRGRQCHTLCVCTDLNYLVPRFWQHFSLIVSCFICRNLILPYSEKIFRQKQLFFSKNQFLLSWNKVFSLKLFVLSKLAKMLLILIKQNLRYTLYFSMIFFFEKTLCNVAQELRYI